LLWKLINQEFNVFCFHLYKSFAHIGPEARHYSFCKRFNLTWLFMCVLNEIPNNHLILSQVTYTLVYLSFHCRPYIPFIPPPPTQKITPVNFHPIIPRKLTILTISNGRNIPANSLHCFGLAHSSSSITCTLR